MNLQRSKWFLFTLALGALMTLAACGKKAAPAPPPPPPPPAAPAPTASIAVNPNSIHAGQSASLTWQTPNATDVKGSGRDAGGERPYHSDRSAATSASAPEHF